MAKAKKRTTATIGKATSPASAKQSTKGPAKATRPANGKAAVTQAAVTAGKATASSGRTRATDGAPAGKYVVGQRVQVGPGVAHKWMKPGDVLVVKGTATESTPSRTVLRVLHEGTGKRTTLGEEKVVEGSR